MKRGRWGPSYNAIVIDAPDSSQALTREKRTEGPPLGGAATLNDLLAVLLGGQTEGCAAWYTKHEREEVDGSSCKVGAMRKIREAVDTNDVRA
jgi:hypothetical protein